MALARKLNTPELTDGEQKVAGMKSIDKSFDAGSGVTAAAGETVLAETRTALDEYNQALAAADDKKNIFEMKNQALRAFNKKVLPAVGLKYGTDSSEYEMVGGTRESDRKKPVRKLKS